METIYKFVLSQSSLDPATHVPIVPIISCRITKKSIVIMALNSSWMAKIVTGTNQKQFSTSVWILYLTSFLSYFCLPLLIQLIQFNPTFPNQDLMISEGSQSSTLLPYPCPSFQHYPIWSDPSTSHSTKKYPSYSTQVAIGQLIIWKLVIIIEFQWYW